MERVRSACHPYNTPATRCWWNAALGSRTEALVAEWTAKRRQNDPAMPSTPAATRSLRWRPGTSDNARLAAVSPLAIFHSTPDRPRRSGSATFGTRAAARSTNFAPAISPILPAVPKMRVAACVRLSGAITSMTDAAAAALDDRNITGIQRLAACHTGVTEFDTRTP